MTCKEVQALIAGSIGRGGPDACTRAERSAIGKHLNRCPTCSAFIDEQGRRHRTDLLDPADAARADREVLELLAQDALDEEA